MKIITILGIIMDMITLKQIGKKLSNCFSSNMEKDFPISDFTHNIDHFIQGLDMLVTNSHSS